jgi:hypothetical protein
VCTWWRTHSSARPGPRLSIERSEQPSAPLLPHCYFLTSSKNRSSFLPSLTSSLADRANGWFADATKFGQICLASSSQKADIPILRRRLVTLSNSLEFLVSQLSYDHVTPSTIERAQQLISRMQFFVVIGSAIVDSLSQLEREGGGWETDSGMIAPVTSR